MALMRELELCVIGSGCRTTDQLLGQQSDDAQLESSQDELSAHSQLHLAGSSRRVRRSSLATRRGLLIVGKLVVHLLIR